MQFGWNSLKLDVEQTSGGKGQAMNIKLAELNMNNCRFDGGMYDEPFCMFVCVVRISYCVCI